MRIWTNLADGATEAPAQQRLGPGLPAPCRRAPASRTGTWTAPRCRPGPVRERLESIGIPPAWTDVWIAPYDNGHIQATGLDAVGRRQYIYHPAWRERKDRLKFDRALQLAESLPTARRLVTLDLRSDGFTRERVLAAAFRMLDSGSLRVGSERYTNENGSHGLATLLCAHVQVPGQECLQLSFPAKSGKTWESEIDDGDLAALVRVLKRRGGNARLLAYKNGRSWHPVASPEINEYVKERTGLGLHRQGLPDPARNRRRRGQPGPDRTAEHRVPRKSGPSASPCRTRPRYWETRRRSPGRAMWIRGYWTISPPGRPSTPGGRTRPKSELRALLYREGDVVSLNSSAAKGG